MKETGTSESSRCWLHRISHEWDVSSRLLKEGYLSIGWSSLACCGIEKTVYPGADPGLFQAGIEAAGLPFSRPMWGLWRFCLFRPGDTVLVPEMYGCFSLYEVTGTPASILNLPLRPERLSGEGSQIVCGEQGLLCRGQTGAVVDLGFIVPAKPLRRGLSRAEYATRNLASRMKLRQTNADISDLAEEIRAVLRVEAPLDFYTSVMEELAQKLLDGIRRQLTPDKFELLIQWYFEKLGASRVYRPGKNRKDKGEGADADVIAEFDSLKLLFYVQAKLHDGMTSQWAVEQILRYRELHEMDGTQAGEYIVIAWVLSAADGFSEQAVLLARENRVRLIAGREFARMLLDAGITDINRAFE